MSKRTTRLKSRRAAAVAAPPSTVPAAFDGGNGVGNDSNRGFIMFPYAKSKDHLKGFDRREAIRLSQWATWKMGAARMATRGLARRAGVVSLAASTTDDAFNAEHTEWFEDMYVKRVGNFDVTGKYTAAGFVDNAMFCAFRDGDVGIAHVTGANGEPLLMAMEASIIRSDYQEGPEWCDGIRHDSLGRPIAYSITASGGRLEKPTIISAAEFYLLANYETHDSVRGTPALFACIDRIRDLREIDNAAIKSAKIQALIALYFKRELGAKEDPIASFSGKVKLDNLAGKGTQTTANYGAPSNIPRKVQEVFDDSEVFDGLGAGVEPKILNDGKDYSAQTPLKEDLYKQIAWGVGVDPRALLSMDGMTGPEVRRVLSDFQKWREHWQAAQLNFLTIDYLRRTEWAIRTRQIRKPKDPRWWSFVCNYPAAATIDAGRDASAQEKKLDNTLTTLQLEYGEQGEGWKPHALQWLKERQFLKTEGAALGLAPEEIFKKSTGTPPPPGTAAAELSEMKASLQMIMEKLRIG